jgi:hypothetical protein
MTDGASGHHQIQLGGAQIWRSHATAELPRRLRRWHAGVAMLGLDPNLVGSRLGFFIFYFILLTDMGIQNTSEKSPIYHDLWFEVFWMPASVNPKCSPRLKLL